MLTKEIMTGIKKHQALAFMTALNKRRAEYPPNQLRCACFVLDALRDIGIDAANITEGTANAVWDKMQTKAGLNY